MIHLDDFVPVIAPSAPATQLHRFHPDGRFLAWAQVAEADDLLDLHVLDRQTGTTWLALAGSAALAAAQPMTLDEELARERARTRGRGITQLRWLPGHCVVLCVVSNRLLFVDATTREVVAYEHAGYVAAVAPSPQGDAIAFVADHDVWLLTLAQGRPAGQARRLTHDGSDTLINGLPDAMTREEIFNGGALCWAGPGRLAMARYDVAGVEAVVVSNGAQTRAEVARYARAGQPVARWSMVSLDTATSASQLLLDEDAAWPYLCGLWPRGAGQVAVLRLRRDQTVCQLLLLDLGTGTHRVLFEQAGQPWLNVLGAPCWRETGGGFFWLHEAHGTARIGLYDDAGAWQRDIALDVGQVESLIGPDLAGDGILFTATAADPRERHVFHASPAGGWACTRWTEEAGTHGWTPGPGGSRLRQREALDHPPRVWLEDGQGRVEHVFAQRTLRFDPAALVRPQLVEVTAADGISPLHAAVYLPQGGMPAEGWPVVLSVYGGPHLQVVRSQWALTLDLRAQWLAMQGFVVIKVDNRGSSGRGIAFEQPVYGQLGHVEVDDQCAALTQLFERIAGLDRRRVGVCGWSYGGYLTLRCLQRRPDLFTCGVAGAPVVDWLDYDAPYTERYMGTPTPSPHFAACNAAGYRDAGVITGEGRITAPLLLVHGMNDENVLLRHSARLIEHLAAQGTPFEQLLMPNERHAVRSAVHRRYLEQRILDFFTRTLRARAE